MASRLLRLGCGAALALVAACSSASTDASAPTSATNSQGDPAPPNPGPPPPYQPDETTALVIGVQDESFVQTVYARLSSMQLTVTIDGKPAYERELTPSELRANPHEITVRPPKERRDAAIDVRLEGFFDAASQPDGQPRGAAGVVRLARTRFVAGETRLLPLRLEARCASNPPLMMGGAPPITGPTCAAPLTCIGARCESSDVAPAELLPYQASWWTKLPDKCRDAGAPEVVLGAGDRPFAPLTPGEKLVTEAGPQCGHHLWLAVKAKGMSQLDTMTTIKSTLVDTGEVVPTSQYAFSFGGLDAGGCTLSPLRYQLDFGPGQWARFAGKQLDVTVELTDAAGRRAQATTRVEIAAQPKNPELPHCL